LVARSGSRLHETLPRFEPEPAHLFKFHRQLSARGYTKVLLDTLDQ
jgi:hypothetical protein